MGLAPSTRHPVAPTTPVERGEVPIPLPVLSSSEGRQLYTKRTDHRFCWLTALPSFFPTSPAVTHRLFFDSRVGVQRLWECTRYALHTHELFICSSRFRHSRNEAELNNLVTLQTFLCEAVKRGRFSE